MKWHSQSHDSFLGYFTSTPLQDIAERAEYKDGLDKHLATFFYEACVERLGGTYGLVLSQYDMMEEEEDHVWEIIFHIRSIMERKRVIDEGLRLTKQKLHQKAEKEEKNQQNEWNDRVDIEAHRQIEAEDSKKFQEAVAKRKAELRNMIV